MGNTRRRLKPLRRFTFETKQVAVVRYFETLYLIRDSSGGRIFAGTDEKTARRVFSILKAETRDGREQRATSERRRSREVQRKRVVKRAKRVRQKR